MENIVEVLLNFDVALKKVKCSKKSIHFGL